MKNFWLKKRQVEERLQQKLTMALLEKWVRLAHQWAQNEEETDETGTPDES